MSGSALPGHERFCGLALVLVVACATPPAQPAAPAKPAATTNVTAAHFELPADVAVRPLGDGVWLHQTTQKLGDRAVSANGLLVDTSEGAVAIDSGWNDQQARALLGWSDAMLHHPVRHLILTHAHDDRLGGWRAMADGGATIHALDDTKTRARASGKDLVAVAVTASGVLKIGGTAFEVYFPGPGHSPDNIVVWLQDSGILFGGCLVEAAGADDLDNLIDANLDRWPDAIARVSTRYGRARIVVPGHGAPGGTELFAHTLALLDDAHRRAGPSRPSPTAK
jgi:metallo-beta-lactamase class B